jgi:hypothetical protein
MHLPSTTWVMSPRQFDWLVQSQLSLKRFIHALPMECQKILLYLYVKEHYMTVEIIIPTPESNEISVYISDSMGEDFPIDELTAEIREANVDIFAASFNPNLPINYIKANEVLYQDNNYDCGVCCNQRAYFVKRFDNPVTIPAEFEYMKDTVNFRLFMLSEILKYHRHDISMLVYFHNPNHKTVEWTSIIKFKNIQEGKENKDNNDEKDDKDQEEDDNEDDKGRDADEDNDEEESEEKNEDDYTVEDVLKALKQSQNPKNVDQKDQEESVTEATTDLPQESNTKSKSQSSKGTIRNYTGGKSLRRLLNTTESDQGSQHDTESEDQASQHDTESDDETENDDEVENNVAEVKEKDDGEEDDEDSNDSDYIDEDESGRKDKAKTIQESPSGRYRIKRKLPTTPISTKALPGNDLNSNTKKIKLSSTQKKQNKKPLLMNNRKSNTSSDPKIKKKVYGRATAKKTKKMSDADKDKQTRIEKAELRKKEALRKEQLSTIRREIDRWEKWTDVPADSLEADLFIDNPNYFIDKKVPQDVQKELNHDINRIKTKMYEPHQLDYEHAKQATDSDFKTALSVAEERHANAVNAFKEVAKQDKQSTLYKNRKKDVLMLAERKKFLVYQKESIAELLPYDAVYGIRSKQGDSNKKEYYVVARLNDNTYKEKLVTRDWIEKHVEKEFLQKFYQAEDERGWILFLQDDADEKLIKDSDQLRQLLQEKAVPPVYQYKLNDDDDKIHCIRVAVTFNNPYSKMIVNTMNWAIMTEKHSSKQNPAMGPWANTDENGVKTHIYWECKETLLQAALGETTFQLIKTAIRKTWEAEYRQPGTPFFEPSFIFDDNPHVEFKPNSTRFIDRHDLSKGSFLKNRPSIFKPEYCGIFSHRQYYYFDMRDIKTDYFVNVNTRQISGIYYDPSTQLFTGLEKFREKGRQKYKKVPLETEWVETNINAAVIKAAKTKVKLDRKQFVKLPVGLGRPIQTSKAIKKNPKIFYPQYGQDTCVFSSLSSALYFLKYEDTAYSIDSFKMKLFQNMFEETFENLMGTITTHIHNDPYYSSFRKKCEIRKISNCTDFDLLKECRERESVLYHVVIISKDGGENHAICIVQNWIFDGNYTNALPLSQESLNLSCDSEFEGIACGYKYIFG